jgi:glutaredoxin
MSDKRLIVYGRTAFCPDLGRTQRFLQANNVEYTQINIDEDAAAGSLVEQWVGHRSVPTVVIAAAGDVLPIEDPAPLAPGRSARSVDRGSLITEPSDDALKAFLSRNGLM